jgi:hypothetical protein
MAERVEFADVDHAAKVACLPAPSSVIAVTLVAGLARLEVKEVPLWTGVTLAGSACSLFSRLRLICPRNFGQAD